VRKLKEEDYKDELVEFKSVLAEIWNQHGWTLADLRRHFSDDLFDYFYFGDVQVHRDKDVPLHAAWATSEARQVRI
jgi:hypothetical protein